MKRALSVLLVIIMVFGMITTSFAAPAEANEAADTLYDLGLFNGTGTDANGNPIYDLDRAPTRHEAVTMLVRLLGKDAEAKAGNWDLPFTDVAAWAKPYVGYAYANGLTSGTSATTFGGNAKISASQYLTFVLRALGYTSGTDFQWNKAWELSDEIGLTNGEYDENTDEFLRSDIVIISENALETRLKGSNVMLLGKLYNQKHALKWQDKGRNIKMSSFELPDAIGKTTLTYDKAYALLGKDPEVIADSIKTVGDVVLYMNAVNFDAARHEAFTPWYINRSWGFDPPGYEGLNMNYGTCCAGNTNVALYLLKGDYEGQGVIRWMGGGNHTIAYVKADGKYYVFDPTDFAHKKKSPITILDNIEDYYDHIPSDYPKAEMTNLIVMKDTDVAYPWGWDNRTNTLIFPAEVKENVVQLYPEDSTKVSFANVNGEIPLWNSTNFDVPADRALFDTYDNLKEQYAGRTPVFNVGMLSIEGNGNFGSPVGSNHKITVSVNGNTVTDYTLTSDNPDVCEVIAGGETRIITHKVGECVLTLTYSGKTYTYDVKVF